jgi:hypothetical protein
MTTVGKARKNHTHHSAFAYPGGEMPPQSPKMIYWQTYSVNYRPLTAGCNAERVLS